MIDSSDSSNIPPKNDTPLNAKSAPRQAAIFFIFITVVLDVLSLGVIIPVLPKLIQQFVGSAETAAALPFAGEAILDLTDRNQDQAAPIYGLFVTIWAMMQFIFAPILGALSDRFGRRPVLLLSCLGLGLDYILMAMAPNLSWLFVGRLISGITAASFSTAAAYIADITSPEKRAASYAMFGAAWGLGFVLGPAVGGALGAIDLRWPFWLAAALTLLNAAYGFFVLPESLAPQNRRSFSWKRANPLGSLKLLHAHPGLLSLAAVILLYQLAHQVLQSVFVYYSTYRYLWDVKVVGYTLMAVGIASIVVQGFVVRRAAPLIADRSMLILGLVFGACGYAIYGLAPNANYFWCGIPVFAMVGFFSPGIQSMMTKRVGVDQQGQLQGVNSSLMGIAGMIGPALFTNTFKYAVPLSNKFGESMLGAPFYLAALLHIIALGIVVGSTATSARHAEAKPDTDPNNAESGKAEPDVEHAG